MPLVAAILDPASSSIEVIGELAGTTTAAHSGWENTAIVLMAAPLARATNDATPAVDPTSITSAFRFSFALLLPLDSTHSTLVPSSRFSRHC